MIYEKNSEESSYIKNMKAKLKLEEFKETKD
jgi:hypothetical protein